LNRPVREACPDQEVAISLHAAGALEAEESDRLMAHVQGCAACREVLAASARALGLARLPPLSEPERHALSGLPGRVLGELRLRAGRRRMVFRASTITAAAAAVLLAFASPVILRKGPPNAAGTANPTTEAPRQEQLAENDWQEPDLDDLWDASDVLDIDSTESRTSTLDAAVNSYDTSVGD